MSQTKEQIFNDVYTILVEECGAPDGSYRQSFVHSHTEEKPEWHSTTTEWRFGGKLGFGGKFWVREGYGGGFTVNCYNEDATLELLEVIEKANEKLAELFKLYKEV